jgi:hypothetical protein
MSAGVKRGLGNTIARLILTLAGALLMVATPYVFEVLGLAYRLHNTMIAGIELASLVVGSALLYLAFRQPASPGTGG